MKLSRRTFLQMSATLASSTALTALPSTATASNIEDGHKALVCIFLFGGNDAYNMLVPMSEPAYSQYITARPDLGLTQDQILPTGLATDNGVQLGIHHAMASMLPLFTNGQASAFINSGQLIEPATRTQIEQKEVRLPDFLMAHNSQQDMWQSGAENLSHPYGWAGRMMDMLGISSDISPLFSITNEAKLLRNANASQVIINSSGVDDYTAWDQESRVNGYFSHFRTREYTNVYERNYAQRMQESVIENQELKNVLNAYPATGSYPQSDLAEQLSMVSRLIQAKDMMGQKRQVFFVGIGGFDTHKNQQAVHHDLLAQVSDAIAAFNQDINEQGLNDQVTSITMSDFGRRIIANASGTDHGWGGHQIISGGAVNTTSAYGSWPDLTLESESNYNNGRIIPGIAADQVNASLCSWFGLSNEKILELFPNLNNFDSPDLDFFSV
ncbi:DUF1501 domain-containing protein [Psychromonas ossibalaenae]|uniref:DUF1501 domain-containing protein n=1 Tax=Psychromonas ossibalaenae TaxID=444922 RepID=UPI00036A2DA5|nr:DUF1501 domain-containing protein [Psychromonas ossibalaenae]